MAIFWMAAGQVAENMAVWRPFSLSLQKLIMYRTSSSKPISSMRSASSRTKNSTALKSQAPSLMRSLMRPGVATTQSTPFFSATD